MPNTGSHYSTRMGKDRYFLVKNLPKSTEIEEKSHYYNFGDGWGANVKVEIVGPSEAKLRRKVSKGFSGYEWMIDEILEHGRIRTREERFLNDALEKLKDKAPIVRHFYGYIVLAQNEADFRNKCEKISRGDTVGFYKLKEF